MTDVKPWYRSKTLWVNVLVLLAAVLHAAGGVEWVSKSPHAAEGVAAMLALVNLALRMVTGKAIEGSPADKDAILRESGMIR